jgi:DNA-directed RNA polymerase subunit M
LKQKQEEKKPTKFVCDKCGYSTTSQTPPKAEPKKTKAEKSSVSIKVLAEEDDDIKPLPTTNIECPKCKHDTAVWWMLQTRGGDEPTTQFYRCVKCNHTWRHYA